MDKVQKLRDERDTALSDSAKLEELLRRYNLQLNNSGTLTDCLEDEYNRWSQNTKDLNNFITKLVGDVFLASCSLSYYGPFFGNTREMMISVWQE
jgi:dynein heavy chain